MPIPNWQAFNVPILNVASDGRPHRRLDFERGAADQLGLSDEERNTELASGAMTVLRDRCGWAYYALFRAGLLNRTQRGVYEITERGRTMLTANPERIDEALLSQFPEFVEYRNGSSKRSVQGTESLPIIKESEVETVTPQQAMENAFRELRTRLAQDLLDSILIQTPAFFERLVVDLLVRMGYGGSRRDAGQAVGQAGDGGIDGVIKEDRLGLDIIYLQAKRWKRENKVSRADVQAFVGSLAGRQAHKGVFITTSSFQDSAREYVQHLTQKVSLIDGLELADLCIEYDLGALPESTYIVKRLDSEYFNVE